MDLFGDFDATTVNNAKLIQSEEMTKQIYTTFHIKHFQRPQRNYLSTARSLVLLCVTDKLEI